MDGTVRIYKASLEFAIALVPLVAILYLELAQNASLLFENHLVHELVIGVAILLSAFVTFITWRCYTRSGERFLYWLTVGFLGFTVIYAPHGVFTAASTHNMPLFLLYGPVSRLVMAACILMAAKQYDEPARSPGERSSRAGWGGWIVGFLVADLLVACLANSVSPMPSFCWTGRFPWFEGAPEGGVSASLLRYGFEGTALVFEILAAAMLWRQRATATVMVFCGLSLVLFAQSSLAFLLAQTWNHQWWLAHAVFAAGFFVLSHGVARAYLTSGSFASLSRVDELEAELSGLKLLKTIFDCSTDAIFVKDNEGRYVLYNREAARERGCVPEDVLWKTDLDLFPAEQAAQLSAKDEEIKVLGMPLTYEEILSTVEGDRTFLTTKGPLIDHAGKTIGLFGIARDITERKQAEEQLRIAAVAFDSHEAMMVTDSNGKILQVNRTFSMVTGYSPEEVIGRSPAILKSGRQDAAFYRNLWEAAKHEGHWQGEIWNRRKDGGIYPEWLSISAIRNPSGELSHFIASFSDISAPREAERKILELAFYDPLTALPNRRLLKDRIQQALASSARSSQYGALLLIDLDHFKTLNDTRGHDVGDQLLVEVAKRLHETLRESDTASRLGGDEFVVLLQNMGQDEIGAALAVEGIAEKLRHVLSQTYILGHDVNFIAASIGISLFHGHDTSSDVLLKQSDLALYEAKNGGRNLIRFFNPAMQAALESRAELEAGLRRALAQDEFKLHYQPQFDADDRLIGAEALVRWFPPGLPVVSPALFIPVAEESGLILGIGRWVLESACRQLRAWADWPELSEISVAVNISARQLHQTGFLAELRNILATTGANPHKLKLELTESSVVDDLETVIEIMNSLSSLGVSFSMDDFGTGYSSLANLKRLPLEQLKIDQSFVRDIPEDADGCAIASAIIALGKSLRLVVIAEGVETQQQLDFLSGQGCHAYQGYFLGRPMPAEAFENFAKTRCA